MRDNPGCVFLSYVTFKYYSSKFAELYHSPFLNLINMELKLDQGPRLSLIRTRVLLKIIGTFDQLGGSQQLGVLGLHPEQGGQYRRVSDSLH